MAWVDSAETNHPELKMSGGDGSSGIEEVRVGSVILSVVTMATRAHKTEGCKNVCGSEVLHRKDRHRHGRGVLIYTAESLIVSLLPNSVYDLSLEFLPISVTFYNQKFCIAVFYRPPDPPSGIFDTVFHSLELIDISQFIL